MRKRLRFKYYIMYQVKDGRGILRADGITELKFHKKVRTSNDLEIIRNSLIKNYRQKVEDNAPQEVYIRITNIVPLKER